MISSYPPTICGIGDYVECLLKELVNLTSKFNVNVIAEFDSKSDDPRINIHPVFDRKNYSGKEIIDKLNEIKPNITHFQHSYGIFGADERFIKLLEAAKSINSRIIVTFHTVHSRETLDFEMKSYDVEDYNRIICSYADHIIVHTYSMKQVLVRQGINPNKISVIRIGAFKFSEIFDSSFARNKLNLPLNNKLILIPGFIHRSKGTKIAIRLARELLKYTDDFKLVIAGWIHPKEFEIRNKRYAYECMQLIKKYNLEEHVIATKKNLPRNEFILYFCASDLVLLPYTQFNWSASGILKVAIGYHKPFIVTRIPKFEEVSEEISDEITVLPNDLNRMVKVAYRLLYDDEFRNQIIDRIKKYAEKVSWRNIAKEHLKIYSNLI